MTDESEKKISEKTEALRRKPWGLYLKQCAKHLWSGICDLWPFWICIFLFSGVLLILSILDCQEDHIRLIGMFLQLAGVLTVAKGLRDSGRLFEKPSFHERLKAYFTRFPSRFVTVQTISGERITVQGTIGKARLIFSPGEDTPLENRVKILEERTESLFGELGELRVKSGEQLDTLAFRITEEVAERERGQSALEKQLKRAVIGSIHVEWWGVTFFIFGIVLATVSPELESLMFFCGICPR